MFEAYALNVWGLVWMLGFLVCIFGWGALVSGRVSVDAPAGWGMTGVYGLGVVIALGGIQNGIGLGGRWPLFAVIGGGLILAARAWRELGGEMKGTFRWLAGGNRTNQILLALLLGRLAIALYQEAAEPRDEVDDRHAYIAQAVKITQTGLLGVDPFSERRMSSLGGQPYLLGLFRVLGDDRQLRLVDGGVGLLLYLGMIVAFFRRRGATPLATMLVLAWVILLPPFSFNVGASVMAGACFLALFWSLLEFAAAGDGWRETWRQRGALIGVIVGTIAALKSTLGLCLFLALGFWGLWLIANVGIRRALSICVAIAVPALAITAGWMWLSRQSNGSWFYPYLGKGWHGSAYGLKFFNAWDLPELRQAVVKGLTNVNMVCALLVPFLALRRSLSDGERKTILACGLAAILACAITGLKVHGDGLRYGRGYVHAAAIFGAGVLFGGAGVVWKWRSVPGLGAAVLAGLLATQALGEARALKFFALQKFWRPQTRRIIRETTAASHRAAQNSIPAGALFLEHVEYSFAFDFRRNPIYICDFPSGANPPPGMPRGEGRAEDLANYLLANGVRYVVFSHLFRPLMPPKWPEEAPLPDPGLAYVWSINQLKNAYDFQRRLFELSHTRRKLFDDGQIWVLDLKTRN